MSIIFKGDFNFPRTQLFFERILNLARIGFFDKYGRLGVQALKEATPSKSTATANAWHYKVTHRQGRSRIDFYNTNEENGQNVAILLEYGHGTRYGGWVEGRRYIEPALQPVFEQMALEIWEEVKR